VSGVIISGSESEGRGGGEPSRRPAASRAGRPPRALQGGSAARSPVSGSRVTMESLSGSAVELTEGWFD
jgi:hypothetical protein